MNKPIRFAGMTAICLALAACSSLPSWMGGEEKEIVRLPGERITVLPVSSELQADESIRALPVNIPAPSESSEWAQHSGKVTSASGNLALQGELQNEQTASAGDGEEFEHTALPQPLVAAGMVFAMDGAGKISAHDAANIGDKKWLSAGVSEEDIDNANGGGLVYDQGKIYATSGRGVVVAIDAATGALLWRKSGFTPFRAAPKVAGGKVFAITLSSEMIAFDAASGEPLWSHRGMAETTGLMNMVSPGISGDVMVVPYASGELYALSVSDGRELWNNSLSMGKRTEASAIFSGIGGDPVIDGEAVFAVSNGGVLSVYGMALGQPLWSKPIASINTPWLSGDWLFVLTTDNVLVAMVKYDGRVRWATRLAGFENEEKKLDPIVWRGPVMVNGRLAVVGSHGEMVLVSAADGSIERTVEIPEEVYVAPSVAGGRLYLLNKDAQLISLQ